MNIAHSEILQWKMGVCYKINEQKMEECVHRTQMLPIPAKVNRGITPKWKKL